MKNVLFLCTGNSCRSIMIEALLKHYGHDKYASFSAGSFPTGNVHPLSLSTLKRHDISPIGYESKSWDKFAGFNFDIVITVCDNASGETCPIFLGSPVKAHWGAPDPANFKGTPEEIEAEFERVFRILELRVKEFVKLPISLNIDDLTIKLHKIGKLYP